MTANGRDAPCRPCGDPQVEIRGRTAADDAAIRRLNDDAFGGTYESRLIEDLRVAGLDAVELVAVENDDIIGHILFSVLATTIDRQPVPALALAPMAVRPDRQRRGIGSVLVSAGLALARSRDWRAVIVLGHKSYYPRFGFSAALARPLEAPFAGDAFMALELAPGALQGKKGRVTYPPAFGVTNA
jgi:putative acetyltransferase